MRRAALDAFLAEQIADAKEQGVLFSVHLKATMMKVSDPIIFGHAVRAFVGDEPSRASTTSAPTTAWPACSSAHPEAKDAVDRALADGPDLDMVDSDRGITNLHVPSDVIIDASMPALIRASGQSWNAAGEQQDTKCVIPDSSYAALYAETIDLCREHGAFDPATMGTTPNVGLMAQKAEEYGSHDKTFEIAAAGRRARRRRRGRHAARARRRGRRHLAHVPDQGRADPATGSALAVDRARATGAPAVFWLDETRAHDAAAAREGRARRSHELDTDGLQIEILPGRRGDPLHARARPRAARTRSRSPATSCATTSPTCSRSSSSAPARRCSRSCR